MIKRRFYKREHGDGDDASDSFSSSSDSELEAEATEESEEEDNVVAEVRENDKSCSTSSGYESENSSADKVDVDSSGLLTKDDIKNRSDEQNVIESHSSVKSDAETVDMQSNTVANKDSVPSDVAGCILKCKSVFKCRLCPRIVCLTEETLKAHLKSKRHARSEKLLSEGKLMLNSDGEIEGETHAERHAPIVASAQNTANSKKKNKGRQRQRKRLEHKQKMGEDSNLGKAGQSTKNPAKKRRKK
uniref:C2H2-type domain-containing protein n=1 Tax=Davidia involucrata TaxID=16924 RepID=A0A5B7APZ3_DAVIN